MRAPSRRNPVHNGPLWCGALLLACAALSGQEPRRAGPGELFRLRDQGRRSLPAAPAAAVERGLQWLAANQQDDGSWSGRTATDQAARLGVTSLALLAMLGDGNTLRSGPHRGPVKNGIKWLRDRQRADGAYLDPDREGFAALQGMAALAMAEAWMCSSYKLLERNAETGIACMSQRRCDDGGWSDAIGGARSDEVAVVWGASLCLFSAADEAPPPGRELGPIARWLSSAAARRIPARDLLGQQVPLEFAAVLRGEQAAANVLTHFLVGGEAPAVHRRELQRMHESTWEWRPGISIYQWACSAQALALDGEAVSAAALRRLSYALAAAQQATGDHAGSWPPVDASGEHGGRAWTTALAVLALEAPYRYVLVAGR